MFVIVCMLHVLYVVHVCVYVFSVYLLSPLLVSTPELAKCWDAFLGVLVLSELRVMLCALEVAPRAGRSSSLQCSGPAKRLPKNGAAHGPLHPAVFASSIKTSCFCSGP